MLVFDVFGNRFQPFWSLDCEFLPRNHCFERQNVGCFSSLALKQNLWFTQITLVYHWKCTQISRPLNFHCHRWIIYGIWLWFRQNSPKCFGESLMSHLSRQCTTVICLCSHHWLIHIKSSNISLVWKDLSEYANSDDYAYKSTKMQNSYKMSFMLKNLIFFFSRIRLSWMNLDLICPALTPDV